VIIDGAANCGAAEYCLDELVLAEGLRKVILYIRVSEGGDIFEVGPTYIHLRCETLLTIAHHGVCS